MISQLPSVSRKPPETLKSFSPSTKANAEYCPTGPDEKLVKKPHSPITDLTHSDRTTLSFLVWGRYSYRKMILVLGDLQEVRG